MSYKIFNKKKIYFNREYKSGRGAVVVFHNASFGQIKLTVLEFPGNEPLDLALRGTTITIEVESINLDSYKLVNPIMNKVKRIGGEPSGSNHEKKD
jgi:hypothetical protein